ncbi:MAG: hypothetical protein GX868_06220, partial [Actinobacteria bacterium]|nr:hypothetical protein [Actinomycetota bacterium]
RQTGQNGLHHVLVRQAAEVGIELRPDSQYNWLTNRGHLEPAAQQQLPSEILAALEAIFRELGGDETALRSKKPRRLEPDLVHPPTGLLVEVDEVQHFTSARGSTVSHYPSSLVVGFEAVPPRVVGFEGGGGVHHVVGPSA